MEHQLLDAYRHGELHYFGHSGSGFTNKALKEMVDRLKPLFSLGISKQVSAAALRHPGASHIPPQHPADTERLYGNAYRDVASRLMKLCWRDRCRQAPTVLSLCVTDCAHLFPFASAFTFARPLPNHRRAAASHAAGRGPARGPEPARGHLGTGDAGGRRPRNCSPSDRPASLALCRIAVAAWALYGTM